MPYLNRLSSIEQPAEVAASGLSASFRGRCLWYFCDNLGRNDPVMPDVTCHEAAMFLGVTKPTTL